MDKGNILKSFTIGFIPLLVFIVADEVYGTTTGLVAAIVFGLAEMAWYYFRERRIERFVLYDILLILLLGAVSIVLDNEIFFKLKPAFIEFILAILLAIHAFSSKPLLLMMGQRFLKDMQIGDDQKRMMRNLSRVLFFVVFAHAILVIYAALHMSNEAWGFISGGLFYIVFALIFAGQFLYLRLKRKKAVAYTALEGEEWFDTVTPQGKVTGRAPRSAVHGDPRLLHPVVHLHVFNRNGQLYLQKRSFAKEVQPGKWDTSVGGHILAGEGVDEALQREAAEELGIKNTRFEPLYRYVMKNDFESELVYTFRAIHNGPFRVNQNEIQFGRFWKISEISKNLGKSIFTPNFEQEFQMLRKTVLANKGRS